jgi:type III secretion system YscQ/HrcQ family protein
MNHSQAWLKKITPDIFDTLSLSDKGTAPPFLLEEFTNVLKESLGQNDLKITLGKMDFIEEGDFLKGLEKRTFSTPLGLFPLDGIFHLIMGINDIKALISSMQEDLSFCFSLEDEETLKGVYTYFITQGLDAVTKVGIYKDLSFKIMEGEINELLAFAIDFKIHVKGNILSGRILIPKSFYKVFQSHYTFIPPTLENLENIPNIFIPISIHTGSISLTQKELQEVEKGDYLLLYNSFYSPSKEKGSFQMKIGNRSIFQVKKQKDGIKILDYLYFYNEENMDEDDDSFIDDEEEFENDEFDESEQEQEFDEEEPLEDELENEQNDEFDEEELKDTQSEMDQESSTFLAPEKTSLSDIPLTICMEIARFSISLEELKKLSPGFKLPVNINPSKVNLMISGKCIGTGEIIEIGDAIGVKVNSINK